MKKMLFLIKLISSFYLFIFPTTLFGSDVLQQIDVLDNLRFNSSASDGKHFIFTRYDTTGNRYELVFYDLKEKKTVITVPHLPYSAKYLFSDDKYILVQDKNYPGGIIVIDRQTINILKKINLNDGVIQAFIIEQKLYVIQHKLWLIYDLKTFKLLSKKEVKKSDAYHLIGNNIVGIGNQIITYDKDVITIQQIDNKLQCQLGMSGTIKGRLFFSDICGKIYEYDLKTFERKTVFDMGTLDIRSGLHKFSALNFDINDDGLLIAVHSNKESYPKLIDIKSGQLLKTLTVKNIPDYIMIDSNMLYFIFSDWLGKKSRIEAYNINKSLLYSNASYVDHLKKEHQKALSLYHETKDYYKAIEVLENADISLLIKEDRQLDISDKVNILNDYAYFLSLTYDRYKEAIPLLEQALQLSKDRTSTHINMADTYYKLYKYEKAEKETLQKAKDYYEIYIKLMDKEDKSKNILKRSFIDFDKKHSINRSHIIVSGLDEHGLLFWKDKLFVGEYGCYLRNDGLKIYVYDRDDYSLLKEIEIMGCSHEQQNDITSLKVKNDKLIVEITCEYENDKKLSFFSYDLNTYKNVKIYHSKKHDEKKDFFSLDISYLMHYTDTNNIQYLHDFILSGKTFERIKGSYGTNNKKYLITSGKTVIEEKQFHIYNLSTLEKHENIELLKNMASFLLFDNSFDKLAIIYHTSPKTVIEIYDIKNKQRRNILSLENNSGGLITITPQLQTYKHYLIIAHMRNIIFYDTKKMEIAEVIKDVIPEYKSEQERNSNRIYKLVIDEEKKRLLFFTLNGQHNSYIELDFLKN